MEKGSKNLARLPGAVFAAGIRVYRQKQKPASPRRRAEDFESQQADGFSQLIFRFAAAFGSSVLVGSPIALGSAFTYQSLFFFRPRVRSGPSFLGGSPILP